MPRAFIAEDYTSKVVQTFSKIANKNLGCTLQNVVLKG